MFRQRITNVGGYLTRTKYEDDGGEDGGTFSQ